MEDVAQGVEPGALFAIGLHDGPWGVGGVGVEEHALLRDGVFIPFIEGGEVDEGELPLLQRVRLALFEAATLLFAAHREPELDEMDAAAREVALELGDLAHEFEILLVAAESHDPLDARPVVPGAVEHHDLALRREVFDVALEIPLATLFLGRFLKGDDSGAPRIEMFHETLDSAAFPRRVSSFEEDHDPLPAPADPGLELEQLDLETVFFPLVVAARHEVFIGVAALPPILRKFEVGPFAAESLGSGDVFGKKMPDREDVVGRGSFENDFEGFGEILDAGGGGRVENVRDCRGLRFACRRGGLGDGECLDALDGGIGRDVPAGCPAAAGFSCRGLALFMCRCRSGRLFGGCFFHGELLLDEP